MFELKVKEIIVRAVEKRERERAPLPSYAEAGEEKRGGGHGDDGGERDGM